MTREHEWFERLWNQHADRVFEYSVRRVGHGFAGDVVAEAFAVAWRRREAVPDAELPWLYGVARNVISQHFRSEVRHRRLVERATSTTDSTSPSAEGRIVDRDLWERVLMTMEEADTEALLLVAWEGLSPREAAAAMGCSPGAFRMRLSRARKRFRQQLELAQSDMGVAR